MTDLEDLDKEKRGLRIFGTDVSNIQCFRTSLLTGIMGGLGTGVGYFLFTSNVKRTPHVAFGSYVLLTLGTWGVCRYNWAMKEQESRRLKKGLQTKLLYEGTDVEKQILDDSDYKET